MPYCCSNYITLVCLALALLCLALALLARFKSAAILCTYRNKREIVIPATGV